MSYASMLGFLKQSNLSDIASRGAGGTTLGKAASASIQPRLANVVETAELEQESGEF